MDKQALTPAAQLLIKCRPDIINVVAKQIGQRVGILYGNPSVVVSAPFDAELAPGGLGGVLEGIPQTRLSTVDDITFHDPITGETVTFRKVKE